MNRYDALMQRIHAGEKILIDGATGTEMERRGVHRMKDAWFGGAAFTDTDMLRQVHIDYLKAGAEIIISNTFATHEHVLRDAGHLDNFEALNRRSVELCIEARTQAEAHHALVAAGLSYWSWKGDHPPLDVLAESLSRQAMILKEAGAELMMLEMMVNIDRMLVTLDAAQSTGLPVWVGLSCRPRADGVMSLYREEPLRDAIRALKGRNVPMLNIMHTDVLYIDECLDIAFAEWDGPIGVYAHSGTYIGAAWDFPTADTPEDHAAYVARWLDRGISMVGTCCGTRTDHIAKIAELPQFAVSR